MCKCTEGKVKIFVNETAYRQEENNLQAHNCEYVEKRNALIPRAERMARAISKEAAGPTFLRCMDFLVKEAGLLR